MTKVTLYNKIISQKGYGVFMLTPLELEKKEFKGGIGYTKRSVNEFFIKVREDYEKLYKENIELKDKINLLNEGIGQYKAMEEVLKTSMINAQTSAEEIKKNAQEKAENIIQEAEFMAQKNREFSNQEVIDAKVEAENIRKELQVYKAKVEAILKSQLDLLKEL